MFEAHFPKIKKTHVVIEYGAPVYPKDLDKETRKHLAPYFEQIIKETIQKNVRNRIELNGWKFVCLHTFLCTLFIFQKSFYFENSLLFVASLSCDLNFHSL
mgnify:FL=1